MSRIDSLMDLIGLGIKKTQPDPTTGTVSKLDEAILNMRQNKMQANQVENALLGMKDAGVKRAEMQDRGLLDWLDRQEGSVTQEDIARYLDENQQPIGVTQYDTQIYKPLESVPELQIEVPSNLRGVHAGSEEFRLRMPGMTGHEEAKKDWVEWVINQGGTPGQADYFLSKIIDDKAGDFPELSAGGQFDPFKFAEDRSVWRGTFGAPHRSAEWTDPASGAKYKINKPYGSEELDVRGMTDPENGFQPYKVPNELMGTAGQPMMRSPRTLDEAMYAINEARTQGIDKTRHSHITDPGLDLGTYREDVFTVPDLPSASPAGSFTHEGHWPGVKNPNVHLRSSHRELDDGGFSIHLEELQSDWHQQAQKLGYWSLPNTEKVIEASEIANRAIADKMSKSGSIRTEVTPMTDGFDIVIKHVDPKSGIDLKLGLVESTDDGTKLEFFNDATLRDYFPDMSSEDVKAMFEEAAKKQMKVHNMQSAPSDTILKGDEWKLFGLKQAIKRAIDEGASGITLPNGEDMILKEGVMGDSKIENSLRQMYDQKLPSLLKKIGKQYGVKPETRKVYYGDEEVERTFLPLTDEMIEKIMNEGMKKYGKQDAPKGILDSLGDMYA